MSLSTIESDYTPKDFLEKLLGKKLQDKKIQDEIPQHSQVNGNSQSIGNSFNHNQISQKTPYVKRIHFQSVENLRNPKKNLTDIQAVQQKNVLSFKQNSKQQFNKQRQPLKVLRDEDLQFASILHKTENEVILKTQQQTKIDAQKRDSENLSIEKAMLLLKVTLNGILPQLEIQTILTKIQKGIKNSSEFDQIIYESQSNTKIPSKQTTSKTKIQPKTFWSKSSEKKKINSDPSSNRYFSQRKKIIIPKSKKQRRNEIQSTKKQILSTVKKMKQLFFLNQKSLKMTKRT